MLPNFNAQSDNMFQKALKQQRTVKIDLENKKNCTLRNLKAMNVFMKSQLKVIEDSSQMQNPLLAAQKRDVYVSHLQQRPIFAPFQNPCNQEEEKLEPSLPQHPSKLAQLQNLQGENPCLFLQQPQSPDKLRSKLKALEQRELQRPESERAQLVELPIQVENHNEMLMVISCKNNQAM